MARSNDKGWQWLAFVPSFGGVVLVVAGAQNKDKNTWASGLAILLASFIFAGFSAALLVTWAVQAVAAVRLIQGGDRQQLAPQKKYSVSAALPPGTQFNINTCSKDEMVRGLGMPIVYANEIEEVRSEGMRFMDMGDLENLTSIPNDYLRKLRPHLIFEFDYHQESGSSWRRLNHLSQAELVALGIDEVAAAAIVEARAVKGEYTSLVDVKRKTGIPINRYRNVL